ncbi:VPLPA-CTERM sorting domain-containing protein [uncultured Marivita sp.]|uniref:VPLPA-CTERM sorting domain-containing protein n=1 Tax=uncultured Marivita sp. TaxID=888080 RepID=UPI00261F1194|nr:VPLPA-CTERM sorting domain-containing protein [uncultured Marivita sp.]
MKSSIQSFAVATFLSVFGGFGANAATITLNIVDIPETTLFGQLSYTGNIGDILGFYSDGLTVPPASAPLSTSKAERYDTPPGSGNAGMETLVQSLTGLAVVNLGGTELPISNSSATVAANTYFTTKFGQSVAVFWNTSDLDILVTFDDSNNTCSGQKGNSNQCGTISHFKAISDGTGGGGGGTGPMLPVPLPAGLPLILSGLGVFGFLRLRSRKSA